MSKNTNTPTHPLKELEIILGAVVTDRDEDSELIEEAKELVESLMKDAGLDDLGMPTGNRWFIVHGRMYDKDDECGVYHCATAKEAQRKFREEQGHDFNEYPEGCEHEGPNYAFIITCFDCGTNKPECV